MDVPLIIRRRLKELGVDQKDLAFATQVTESYISQLLAGKKLPPAPDRTDIYGKLGKFLKLPAGELSRLASLQRREVLKKKILDPPSPLFHDFRALILRKANPRKRKRIQSIFEKEPFGSLERLVTQKLLEVAKGVAREELDNEKWLRLVARLTRQRYEVARVSILDLLDTDVFHVSVGNCVTFLDPLIESWDIDLETFGVDIILNRRLASAPLKRFAFVEREPETGGENPPAFHAFLKDSSLCGEATKAELDFLRSLRFNGRKPTPLYYYRELQNLRDPLNFRD